MMQNRQIPQALTPVHTMRQVAGFVNTIIGASLLGAGAVVFMLNFFVSSRAAVLSLMITGGALAFSGAVELTVAAILRSLTRREQAKLGHLKADGISFPGEIVNIVRRPYIHVGSSVCAYAECTYVNREGKTCLVKSPSFMCSGGSYTAWVYVNPFDPGDYAVEVFTQAPQVDADFDYR